MIMLTTPFERKELERFASALAMPGGNYGIAAHILANIAQPTIDIGVYDNIMKAYRKWLVGSPPNAQATPKEA